MVIYHTQDVIPNKLQILADKKKKWKNTQNLFWKGEFC